MMISLLALAAAIVIYILGNRADYRNSLGRQELNPNYKDAYGYFDSAKFKRAKVRELLLIIIVVVAAMIALSYVTPHFAYAGLMVVVPLTLLGVRGFILSRVK